MTKSEAAKIPLPRRPILAPSLTRPDWTASAFRDPKLLWLDKNENLDPVLAQVTTEVLRSAVADSINLYPDAAPLYMKLAKWVGVAPQNLVLTPGSDGVIRAVFETFISEGDVVMHTLPTFAMYPVYSMMYGVKEVAVNYGRVDDAPSLPSQHLIQAIAEHRPRLVCLPNPDSPTGSVFSPLEMREIVRVAADAGSVILVDEAYHPFSPDTVVPLIEDYPNLIVARTFAKAWGLAGLRIGYAVASREVATFLHKVRPMYEVNTLAVVTMERMLDHVGDMEASVKRLNEGKAFFLQKMTEMGFPVLRGQGNFLHVAFGTKAPAIHSALKDIVLYRPDFKDECLAGYTRFSATTEALFKPVVQAIQDASTSLPR